jgi:hypothetical protein
MGRGRAARGGQNPTASPVRALLRHQLVEGLHKELAGIMKKPRQYSKTAELSPVRS